MREVAGMGMASVIHQITIRRATAAVRAPDTVIPCGTGTSSMAAKASGPAIRPVLRKFME